MGDEHGVLKWVAVDRVLLVCASDGSVEDDALRSLLDAIPRVNPTALIGLSLGSTRLTVLQRTEASKLYQDRRFKTVVLTDSRVTRGLLTAFRWFGGSAYVRHPEDLDGAFDDVGIGDERRPALRTALNELRAAVQLEHRRRHLGAANH